MTAALILAFGEAAFGKAMEPLRDVGSISAVQRLILIFRQAGCERIALVCATGELERHVAHMGVVCLRNNSEMFDGVKQGLAYLSGKCRRAFVAKVDLPLFSVETARRLMASKAEVAVPAYGGKPGHPMLLSARMFPRVLAYAGEGGLTGAVQRGNPNVEYIEVADEGILWDVRRRQGYEHLLEASSLARLRPEVKVYLAREQVFFGPGPCQLLGLVEESGSLRCACEQMGISYSKGWRMVERMERQMGKKLLERRRGGREKGSSSLTEDGAGLLRRYRQFRQGCAEHAERLFEKIFGEENEELPSDGGS